MANSDPCRGCVCTQCAKSERQGNPYGCQRKRCHTCENGDMIIKTLNCDDAVVAEEGGEPFTW